MPGMWDIPVPAETAPEVLPDVLLVPMLAFDAQGYRLGYGGGFYDRTLEKLRALKPVVAIGVAYAAQEVTEVPHGDHDQPLDLIMTEKGPFTMRLMFLGDVVGKSRPRSGLPRIAAAARALPARSRRGQRRERRAWLRHHRGHFPGVAGDAGADVVTLGNHAFDQREALIFIEREPQSAAAAELAAGLSGPGHGLFETANGQAGTGDQRHGPGDDRAACSTIRSPPSQRELEACPLGRDCDAVLIDFHAEATSEKMAMGHFVDGRASLVVGTHTHMPTADHQILPGGTGYHDRCRHVRRLRFGDRHGQGRADATLPAQAAGRAIQAGGRRGDGVRNGGRNRRSNRACHRHCARSALAGRLSQAEVPFW